jgi:hypothetical protein
VDSIAVPSVGKTPSTQLAVRQDDAPRTLEVPANPGSTRMRAAHTNARCNASEQLLYVIPGIV